MRLGLGATHLIHPRCEMFASDVHRVCVSFSIDNACRVEREIQLVERASRCGQQVKPQEVQGFIISQCRRKIFKPMMNSKNGVGGGLSGSVISCSLCQPTAPTELWPGG